MAAEAEPDEYAAWEKAKPRLKGLFRESLDEWINELAATPVNRVAEEEAPEEEEAEEADDAGKEPDAERIIADARGAARPKRAAAAGGRAGAKPSIEAPAKPARRARPSGGSILDVLIGR